MRRVSPILLFAVAVLGLSGCEGHEAKIADLQKEYDRLADKRQADCGVEITQRAMNPVSHPSLSSKCADEDKQTVAAYQRLQSEKTKQ